MKEVKRILLALGVLVAPAIVMLLTSPGTGRLVDWLHFGLAVGLMLLCCRGLNGVDRSG